jgi:hypothetical protein
VIRKVSRIARGNGGKKLTGFECLVAKRVVSFFNPGTFGRLFVSAQLD